jgi:hypothetical protein
LAYLLRLEINKLKMRLQALALQAQRRTEAL